MYWFCLNSLLAGRFSDFHLTQNRKIHYYGFTNVSHTFSAGHHDIRVSNNIWCQTNLFVKVMINFCCQFRYHLMTVVIFLVEEFLCKTLCCYLSKTSEWTWTWTSWIYDIAIPHVYGNIIPYYYFLDRRQNLMDTFARSRLTSLYHCYAFSLQLVMPNQ